MYVENRLRVIKKYNVKHIDGVSNPADIASRGCSPDELYENDFWFRGPVWMRLPVTEWPVNKVEYTPDNEKIGEEITATAVNLHNSNDPTDSFIIDISKFSRLWKIQRIIVFVLRFLKIKILSKVKSLTPMLMEVASTMQSGTAPSSEELKSANKFLLKNAQAEFPPGESTQQHIGIFADEQGLLRCRGRVDTVKNLSDDMK